MTDKKYLGLGSRIVLGTLKPASNSDDEDIFLSDSIADRPELRVQLRYFTVELKPSRCTVRNNSGANECRTTGTVGSKTRNFVNGHKKAESGKCVSPNETTSCDSFHSCRSTTSIQELAYKGNASNKTQFEKQASKTKRTVIRDDDLLNHLTMVNAIFLSKSVSNTTQHESVNNKSHQENDNSCKTNNLSISRVPSCSNKVCSEAYTCQINHNPRLKCISKIYGNNAVTKPVMNCFDTLYGKIGGDRLSYTKTFSEESFETVLNGKKSGLEIENVSTYDRNDLATELNEDLPSTNFFQKKISSNSSYTACKRLEIKVPKMKFAEIIPLCDESSLLVVLDKSVTENKPNTGQKRRKTVPGCEDKFCTPKNSVSLISVESIDSNLESTDNVHGDGDFTDYAYTENSGRRLNKMLFKNIDETYLKMLISKSLKKIQNKSENNLRGSESDESDIFESDEEYDKLNEYREVSLKKSNLNYSQPPLQFKKLKLQSCFQESGRKRSRKDDSLVREDYYNSPLEDEYDDDNYSEEGPEVVTRESSELITDQPEKGFGKRRIGERTRTLPVIQEESSEENEDFRQDDLADDYCLIDSNGRPIHLFDNQGLPLTDNSGRPLRSSQGKLLMNCDQNGIPVVDEECSIFDMFGRQPHEDRFDPSMAPKKAVCSKLSAGDGRPLLLFDAKGRPLTSVSGTMLVDSSGRGLVRLSTAEEHSI